MAYDFKKIPKIVIFNVILVSLLVYVFFYPKDLVNLFSDIFLYQGPIGKRKQYSAVAIQQAFRNVYRANKDTVVTIRTKTKGQIIGPYYFFEGGMQKVASLGSGFLIDAQGYIVTNYHVIKNAQIIEVIDGKGNIYEADYFGSHERADIAVIKISEKHDITPVFFGNSDSMEVGDWAIAIGAPYGLEKSFTVGVVSSGIRKDLDETGQSYIQVDTAINPGNSGGPLFNIYGEVIGINKMIRSRSGENTGIGFAIPVNYAREVLSLIRQNPGHNIRPTTLGVRATAPHPEHRKILGIGSVPGIVVYAVEANSSAYFGGLKRYDFITRANDKTVRDINDLRKQIGLVGLGGLLKLEIIRSGKATILNIRLVE